MQPHLSYLAPCLGNRRRVSTENKRALCSKRQQPQVKARTCLAASAKKGWKPNSASTAAKSRRFCTEPCTGPWTAAEQAGHKRIRRTVGACRVLACKTITCK